LWGYRNDVRPGPVLAGRLSGRGAAGITAVAAALLAAAGVLAGAGRAAAQPAVLYAAVTATGSGDCSDAADACTLSTALGDVAVGGVIELVTPGGTAHYLGNWTISTPGTSAGAPVTVEAAPGLPSQPALDGNNGSSDGCSTASCALAVLTVPGGEYVALSGITIADANNMSAFPGGGLENAGTVTITGCTFTGNQADTGGGAIDAGDGGGIGTGTGTVVVTNSTFSGNSSSEGGRSATASTAAGR
jgi:predicted outer membrane repeat protein